ncbi:Uncharacterised protein r2_g3343 [Pycnogonum litorale]
MRLTTEQRIEIILMAGSGSSRMVARNFNRKHETSITHDIVAKLICKFQKTGNVADQPRSGPTRRATDEDSTVRILAAVTRSPRKSTRRLSAESGVSRSSIRRILKTNKWHPYKLHMAQQLSEDDPDRRAEFCEWALTKVNEDANFPTKILFTDEANFYVNGEVNRQNLRYWSSENPKWLSPTKLQGAGKLMVWAGIWGDRIIGPIFIDGILNAEKYLNMLQEEILPSLLNEEGDYPVYFQQDGAPPHYGLQVRRYLDHQFPEAWIGRRGPVEWPPRSPDLSPLDFYLWGHLKAMVYQVKIRDINHLKERIINAITSITSTVLMRVHQQWKIRINLCIQNNGTHIEHII